MPKSKFAHFTLEDRTLLLALLNEGKKSLRTMAKILRCAPSTITSEVKKYRIYKDFSFGTSKRKCFNERLIKFPYVCNGCTNLPTCKKSKYFYDPMIAHKKYKETLVTSRRKIHSSSAGLAYINELVSPLILNQGQTIDHILLSNELGISRSTLYRYIDSGLLDVKNVDLKRRVRYPAIKKKKVHRIKTNKKNHQYLDFLAYCKAHPGIHVAELDTVIGKRDESKCIFTILLRKSNFMLGFVLEHKTAQEVVEKLDYLEKIWGKSRFKTNLTVCLMDNGVEFDYLNQMERNERKIKRCDCFYCDPGKSNQKGKLEKNHEYIRYYYPQGTSFKDLDQEKLNSILRHINSVRRDSLKGKSPFEMLSNAEIKDMKKLGLYPISPDAVILSSKLFK